LSRTGYNSALYFLANLAHSGDVMPITVQSLYRDSYNFMRNQISRLLLLALLATAIQFTMFQLLQPDFRTINQTYEINSAELSENGQPSSNRNLAEQLSGDMSHLSQEQQLALAKDLMAQMLKEYFPNFITKILLMTWTVCFILLVIRGETANIMSTLGFSVNRLPRMLLIGFVCNILIAIGLTMLILPGIILSFGLALAPIMVAATNTTILDAISDSFKAMTRFPSAIISGTLFSFALSILSYLVLSLLLSQSITLLIISIYFCESLIVIFFTIYFYRLFSSMQPQMQS
jgi:hypothetical protein